MPRLVRTPSGTWAEVLPDGCPACGLRWKIGPRSGVTIGFQHCACQRGNGGGHRSYRCSDCDHVSYDEDWIEGSCSEGPIPMGTPDGRTTR